MSFIKRVKLPPSITFGVPFSVTIEYEAGESNEVVVVPKGTFTVSPETIEVSAKASSVTTELVITDLANPSAQKPILIDFILATSRCPQSTDARAAS